MSTHQPTTQNKPSNYPIEQDFKLPLIVTAIAIFIPTLLLYWFIGEAEGTPRILKLFIGNWISPLILWFFTASFLHLWLKKGRLNKERLTTHTLATENLPKLLNTEAPTLAPADFNTELDKLSQTQGVSTNNLLKTRVKLFLNHADDDIDDTFAIKEREYMKGSFSLPRFMVWAIPIMGFIGTVWGISNGIAHFSDAMTSTTSVTDVTAMLKESLPLVTSSLATAFDTTLLALLFSIPLMMLMLSIEKSEEAYLTDLDETWFHAIKPMLQRHVKVPSTTANHVMVDGTVVHNDGSQRVADEITLLSTQIKALQETMEDLYETVFTDKLAKQESKER